MQDYGRRGIDILMRKEKERTVDPLSYTLSCRGIDIAIEYLADPWTRRRQQCQSLYQGHSRLIVV